MYICCIAEHDISSFGFCQIAINNIFLMPPDEQQRLIENIVGALKPVPKDIQEKTVAHFYKADQAYGEGVEKGLGR